MDGLILDEVISERDLGITISSNLKVSEQCQSAYLKANCMLGLVKRTIHHRNPDLLVRLYKSLVRPHLEYCSLVWSPHYNKDKSLLERVQHRFTHLFENLKDLSYETRLRNLKLWTVEERRNRSDLIELYKMIHGFSGLPFDKFFTFAPYTATRGHSQKLAKRHSNTDIKMFSFSARVINRWNSLPQDAVDSTSVNSFKGQLQRLRSSKMGFFMDSWSA